MTDTSNRQNDQCVTLLDRSGGGEIIRPNDGVYGNAKHFGNLGKRIAGPHHVNADLVARWPVGNVGHCPFRASIRQQGVAGHGDITTANTSI